MSVLKFGNSMAYLQDLCITIRLFLVFCECFSVNGFLSMKNFGHGKHGKTLKKEHSFLLSVSSVISAAPDLSLVFGGSVFGCDSVALRTLCSLW